MDTDTNTTQDAPSTGSATTGPVVVERPSEEKKRRKPYQGVVNWWNSLTYTTRMTMAFALIAAMTAMVAIGVLSFVWQQHFHTYTQENMESLAESTATRIEEVYNTSHTLHDPQVEAVAKYAESLNSGVGVRGDADMIRQATANLISNAVRYTPEGGTITVSVSSHEGMCAIAVRDTGIGLSPDEAKMVFSRFWRADAGRTRESGGLGIGLSVVKEIVDRHNGYVDVEGEKGVGACFTINLPLYYEGDEQREQRQQQRQQQQQQREQQMQQRQQQREAQRQQKEQQRAQQHAQKTGIPFGRSHDDGK